MPASGGGGREFAEVEDKDGWVDGHVEDAGGERKPAFLISPKRTKAAADPDIKAALGGDGAGEFADHQGGGEAPHDRQEKQDQDGSQEAGAAEDVLNAVGTAGHHEVGGGDQREKAHLPAGRLEG